MPEPAEKILSGRVFSDKDLPVRADVLKRLRRLHGKSDAVPVADGISPTDARGGCAPETQEERVI